MKKVFMVLLLLAIAGGLFAQTVGFTGVMASGLTLIGGDSVDGNDPYYAGTAYRAQLQFNALNAEGTVGSTIRFRMGGNAFGTIATPNLHAYWVWWKPNDFFRITFGHDNGSYYGTDNITRWGFYGNPCDYWANMNGNVTRHDKGMYDIYNEAFVAGINVGGPGSVISLYPIEGLDIGVLLPYAAVSNTDGALNAYKRTAAQVRYTLDGVGRFALTYRGGLAETFANTGKFTFNFYSASLVDGLELNFGFGFKLPGDASATDDTQVKNPIQIGLGVGYKAGDFGVMFRTNVALAGEDKNLYFDADIKPYYAISESLTFFLSAGIALTSFDADIDSALGWQVTPYIVYNIGKGANLNFGAWIYSQTLSSADIILKADKVVNWAIPISLEYSF